ncbi:MAG: hypothetical protein KF774_22070, partial [Planctomyces sp.]|nr:hypothetical protein [Planctomyces sp.]
WRKLAVQGVLRLLLVVDLYKVASDYVVDPVAQRASDLGDLLNTHEDSPYIGIIKLPNSRSRGLGIPLSTVVGSIKELVEPQGVLHQVGLTELNTQLACLLNFFGLLKKWYGKSWYESSNPFLSAAGFTGAIDFLKTAMISHCNLSRDFTAENMGKALALDSDQLIDKEVLKGLQGRAAWHKVDSLLRERFKSPAAGDKVKV